MGTGLLKLKILLILVIVLILIGGCVHAPSGSNTPEEALREIHKNDDYAPQVIDILEIVEVNSSRVLAIYEVLTEEGEEDILIGDLELNERNNWILTNAINIGLPSHKDILDITSSTINFQAGYRKKSDENEDLIIVDIGDIDLEIWIQIK
ncbi:MULTISPECIES: hypothetical protein [Sutcliffiella]|uniref:Lipoprotein n=1 Tax=Sutcliffiella cohnii TaxID=33932 RepID=A0A223KP72_9BACI|nr:MULTISPECIES: hypothetical protein [Sutcliffiella]AST91187.1 hypothetical protein BC6307_07795 [Sutcliffiella cohnii]WBL16997.1 hypothetical protein O1A01_10345 [Sutcliffiella sp. NC1]